MPGVLEIAFTGAAWSKYLGELLASGLLLANFDSLHTLEVAIDGLTIVSIANLTVAAADLQLGESTPLPSRLLRELASANALVLRLYLLALPLAALLSIGWL